MAVNPCTQELSVTTPAGETHGARVQPPTCTVGHVSVAGLIRMKLLRSGGSLKLVNRIATPSIASGSQWNEYSLSPPAPRSRQQPINGSYRCKMAYSALR